MEAYGVNVAENIDILEACSSKTMDRAPNDPSLVEEFLKSRVRHDLKLTLESALEWERDQHVQALRYERGGVDRSDYRNGYRKRELSTTMGSVELKVPRARRPISYTTIQSYKRRWQELDLLLLEAHIGGMSTRQVGERIGGILGRKWSATTISSLKEHLVASLESFRSQELSDDYVALIVDGMYVRIRQCMDRKRPVVVVIGVKADGHCELLAMRVCYSENSTEVEGLLRDVKERGVRGCGLQVVTIDGDKGLESAVYSVYGNVRIQDCSFHRINRLHKNAKSKKRARKMMKEAAAAFDETDKRAQRRLLRSFCDKWQEKEPKAIECFERNLYRSFESHSLPKPARAKASTSGLCEGLFKQIRARIKSMGAFETPMAVELYTLAIVSQKKWIGIPGRKQAAPLLEAFTH
jgi:transposase-like protein